MQLRLSFDVAVILRESGLPEDHPDLYKRHINNTTLHVGRSSGVRVITQTGADDLRIIREYLDLWLTEQELIPLDCKDTGWDKWGSRESQARYAVGVIDYALRDALASGTCHH